MVKNKDAGEKGKQAFYCNQCHGARPLPSLKPGDRVLVKLDHQKAWRTPAVHTTSHPLLLKYFRMQIWDATGLVDWVNLLKGWICEGVAILLIVWAMNCGEGTRGLEGNVDFEDWNVDFVDWNVWHCEVSWCSNALYIMHRVMFDELKPTDTSSLLLN